MWRCAVNGSLVTLRMGDRGFRELARPWVYWDKHRGSRSHPPWATLVREGISRGPPCPHGDVWAQGLPPPPEHPHLWPASMTSPPLGSVSPVTMRNVDVFPAPFTPNNPKHCNDTHGRHSTRPQILVPVPLILDGFLSFCV